MSESISIERERDTIVIYIQTGNTQRFIDLSLEEAAELFMQLSQIDFHKE